MARHTLQEITGRDTEEINEMFARCNSAEEFFRGLAQMTRDNINGLTLSYRQEQLIFMSYLGKCEQHFSSNADSLMRY